MGGLYVRRAGRARGLVDITVQRMDGGMGPSASRVGRRMTRMTTGLPRGAALLVLSVLAACAGDLDPRFTHGGGLGGASAGTGGAPAGNGGGAGGGNPSGTGGTPGTACTYAATVLPTKCGISGCHSGTFPPNLSTEPLAAMVVNARAAMACAGDPSTSLINPAAPVSGILVTRITTANCGTGQMPLGFAPLTQAEIDCIKSYFMSQLR